MHMRQQVALDLELAVAAKGIGDVAFGGPSDAAWLAIGARYALPGAGIALAAKGIGDVAFGGPSDQQEPNQLGMY